MFLSIRIAGHADLAPAGVFIYHGFQFALVFQPLFQVGPGINISFSTGL
jgi:hypothetical protein